MSRLGRTAQWMEILANLGVIVSLVFLVSEVSENTRTLKVQANQERSTALNRPLLENPQLSQILTKIKAVDGSEPPIEAFMASYELTYAEGTIWVRYLSEMWSSLNTECQQLGPSDGIRERIVQLLAFRDQQLWFSTGAPDWVLSDDFAEYVMDIRASTD